MPSAPQACTSGTYLWRLWLLLHGGWSLCFFQVLQVIVVVSWTWNCLTGLILEKCRVMLSMWPKASFNTDFSLIKGHKVSSLGSQPGWCLGSLLRAAPVTGTPLPPSAHSVNMLPFSEAAVTLGSENGCNIFFLFRSLVSGLPGSEAAGWFSCVSEPSSRG